MKQLLIILLLTCAPLLIFGQENINPIENCLSSVVTVALYELSENDAVFGMGEDDKKAKIAYKEALDLSGSASAGSGFIMEYKNKLYIITNAHVVDGATDEDGAINVFNIGRKSFPVRFVGGDSFYDIAVLEFIDEVSAKEFPPIPLAAAPGKLTEKVYAIGNPLGKYPYTITDGIISGKNRVFQNPTTGKYGFLQHTATLIWGNSGGPLVNEKGELVGVNTWIGTSSKENQQFIFSQLNFALESNMAERLITDIIENDGRVRRNFLGVEFATRKDLMGLDSPPFVHQILENSPAYESLKAFAGYYVTGINGEKTRTLQDILRVMENTPPQQAIKLFLQKDPPKNTGSIAGFGKIEQVTITPADLSVESLEKIARFFFKNYADYELDESKSTLGLNKKANKPKARIEKISVQNNSLSFEMTLGQVNYDMIAAGLFDQWGRGTLYRTKSAKDLGAVIRLCSLEGHLSASVKAGEAAIENVRFYLQDDDFNELRVLYF